MPAQNELIRRCFQEAVILSSVMIKHVATMGAVGMRESARVSTGAGAKWLELADWLEAHVQELTVNYCQVLEKHLGQAVVVLESHDLPRMTKEELALLSREQIAISQAVAGVSTRMQGRMMSLTEARLQPLDELVSAALGLRVLSPEVNPFRPEVMCNVLAELCLECLGSAGDAELSTDCLVPPFAGGTKRMYLEMTKLLDRQGVSDPRFKLSLSQMRGQSGAKPAATPTKTVPPVNRAPVSSQREPQFLHPRDRTAVTGQVESVLGNGAAVHGTQPADSYRIAQLPFPSMNQLARVFPGVSHEAMQAFLYDPRWLDLDAPLPPSFFEALERTVQQFTKAALEAQPPAPELVADFHAQRRLLAPVERPSIPLTLNDWLSGAHWGRWGSPVLRAEHVMGLKVQAQQISQVMALDAVGQMLEQLGGETSLLLPVRECFMSLSPVLMRLGFDQPWFLSSEEHPARRFIEMVAQASYEFNDEYSESFDAFLRPIAAQVKKLQTLEHSAGSDIEIAFARAIQQLQSTWEVMSQSDQPGVEGRLKAMHFVSERQSLAHEIAVELASDEGLRLAPEPVARLILEKWSIVLAHVRLIDGRMQPDPGGYRTAARDLVWSLSGHAAVNDPARAFALLPNALRKLREGLQLIGTKPDEINEAMALLLPFHERLLEMRRRRLAQQTRGGLAFPDAETAVVEETMPSLAPIIDRPFDAEALIDESETTPWMNSQDREVMGFASDTGMDSTSSLNTVFNTESTTLAPEEDDEASREPSPEQKLDAMQVKDWFDLFSVGSWHRVQLVWRNEQGTLFMFQSRKGSPHSMTRRSCLRLLKQEQLRPVKGIRSRAVAPLLKPQG